MAAKLLHSLTDDNPDLQKQIGCMTGIFQLFDRQHALTRRRLVQKRLTAGNSSFNDSSPDKESKNVYDQQMASETSRSTSEKRRISTESSRESFSSSCSSLSSLDFNQTVQVEASSFDRIVFTENPSRDQAVNQGSASPHLGRQSLDLRDVVKDSMYREAGSLSVKTVTKEEALACAMKHQDSPRPLQLSKSMDGTSGQGKNGTQNVSDNIKESIRVLGKLQEGPWYSNELKELPTSSCDAKDGFSISTSKVAPRFSYDGRERNRLSFESRETIKSSAKLKDLPRLSLDSRERSMQSSNTDPKPDYLLKNLQSSSNDELSTPSQPSGRQKRPPGVVAKLMGLETLPDSALGSTGQSVSIKSSTDEDKSPFLKPLLTKGVGRPTLVCAPPRNTPKDPISPRWKSTDVVMKPTSSSRVPIEPAPWKQPGGNRMSKKAASKPAKVVAKTADSFPSVYSEIEKRLKDLEFKQSGKDLRALKQIIEAIQAKGFLENRKEEEASNQNPRLTTKINTQSSPSSATKDSDSLRTFESPIVIMKPAKLVEKSSILNSSITSTDDNSGVQKYKRDANVELRRGSVHGRKPKDQTPKTSNKESASSSSDKKASSSNVKSSRSSTRSQSPSKENTADSMKSLGSVSPRLQQKKVEFEKRSRPPVPPSSNSKKPGRQSSGHPKDSGSPGGKSRIKSPNLRKFDDQLSELRNESRGLNIQEDDISLPSDSSIFLDTKISSELTNVEQSTESNSSESPSMASKKSIIDSMQKKLTERLSDDGPLAALTTLGQEHTSPVSVLDASAYRDDLPSPVKQPDDLKDHETVNTNTGRLEIQCNPDERSSYAGIGSGFSTEASRKKLQNVEHLVQKLRLLNSSHDEASTDYIASLCENTNPDHRYISEILLASGLLLRDLGSDITTFQFHPSGDAINPELFLVLEQTKGSTFLVRQENSLDNVTHQKMDSEKFHRKLIFDAVNEMLTKKISLVGFSTEPWLKRDKLAKKAVSAQKLLKELCLEIEQLQSKKLASSLEEEEDDLKCILREDVMQRSESWTDFSAEISGVVLDVERQIFKDLVDEIVNGGGAVLRAKRGRRRQLCLK